MTRMTKERFEEICQALKPEIEDIRRVNKQQLESVPPTMDARSAVVNELLRLLYFDLNLEPPAGVPPVAGLTREGTLKTAIMRLIGSNSDEYFDPSLMFDDLLFGLEVGEM